jgi:Fur family transcriptional regulator, iron response regulator
MPLMTLAERDVAERLEAHGIQASAQRVAVARYVLSTTDHPSADQVWAKARVEHPAVSRATVYNTLNLFVGKGLLKQLVLAEGRVVFDPVTAPHHHFVDEKTGKIFDVPWDALSVRGVEQLGFEVSEHQVVLRGRLAPKNPKKKKR